VRSKANGEKRKDKRYGNTSRGKGGKKWLFGVARKGKKERGVDNGGSLEKESKEERDLMIYPRATGVA